MNIEIKDQFYVLFIESSIPISYRTGIMISNQGLNNAGVLILWISI